MRSFVILAALLVSSCTASLHGAVSTQYQHQSGHSYSYGYADPNSQKHETRSHDGTTHGSYSYVDGHGHIQSVSYTADPHHGFNAVGTNLPKAPIDHNAITPYAATHAYVPYHAAAAVHHVPLTHTGVPVDTPEVQHARAAHLAAHAAASVGAVHAPAHHHLWKRSLYGNPWAHAAAPIIHGGVPVDTPEVQHAKAAHYAAHAAARAGHSSLPAAGGHAGYGGHAGHVHVPVIHNGVPVDTPEVQHAKAAHFAAVAEASSRGGHSGGYGHESYGHDGSYDDGSYGQSWDGHGAGAGASYENTVSHYAPHASHYGGYKGPIHIPVIQNGVPVEPAEVQHARAAHLAALGSASHGAAYYGHGHGGHDDGQYHHHY